MSRHQIPCHRGEILADLVPALVHRLLIPSRPVLAAAADVGEHVRAPASEPQPPQHAVASIRAVELMAGAVGGRLGIKASGGIRTADAALAMLRAGATRLGLSGTAAVLEGL
jgi:hypothetical protein